MSKVRISEVAQETAKKPKEVLDACETLGIKAKAAASAITLAEAEKLMEFLITGEVPASAAPAPKAKPAAAPKKAEPKKEAPAEAEKKEEEPKKEAPVKAEVKKEAPVPKEEAPEKPEAAKAEEPAAEKKEEAPAKAESGEEKPAEEKKKPTAIAQARQGRGLVIVKKKRPKKPEPAPEPEPGREEITVSYGKSTVAADMVDESDAKKRSAKKKSATPSGKKDQGERIDLLADRSLGNTEVETEEDEIFMPDFSLGPSLDKYEDPVAKKPNKPGTGAGAGKGGGQRRGGGNRPGGIAGLSRGGRKKKRRIIKEDDTVVTSVQIPEDIRVYEFADALKRPASDIIKVLFGLGMMVTKNDFLEKDAIEILAEEFEVEVSTKNALDELDYVSAYDDAYPEEGEERPPIVTIMGHVDHGKTSLLDYIRKAKVASGEAGGITQHIGAYTIMQNDRKITFIDTPGHEAFSEMRARGANTTDVVIIVVAADDGVMPQTKEAISHAKAAGVPIITAINKIDKPDANPDMVKAQLAEAGLTPVEWGGEFETVGVSAKSGQGVDDLLELILIQSEVLELEADPEAPAKAIVIESSLEKGRGTVATVIMKNGTLNVGDSVIAGESFGRVRAITDDLGKPIKTLGPSEAGEIIGLDSVPMAGDILVSIDDEKKARELAELRREHARQKQLSKSTKATLDDFHDMIAEGKLKALPIVLKADVQGTLEAIAANLSKLRNEEVKVNIIHSAVGGISESDVALAAASEHAIIMGFHVKPTQTIKDKAKSMGVEIKTYNVIYDLLEEVKNVLGGMLSPLKEDVSAGKAEIREVFAIPKVGTIAGCMVTDGQILRGMKARVFRGEDEIYEGTIANLKRFKDDVKEVKKGYECGIMLTEFDEVQAGDIIEVFREKEVAAKFVEAAPAPEES